MTQYATNSRLAVIGAGSWGTTLANLLATKGYTVSLWAHNPTLCQWMRERRENTTYLPGVALHANVRPTSSLTEAVRDANTFISVMPSHAVRAIWRQLAPLIPIQSLVVSATKGIEAESLQTISCVLQDIIAPDKQAHLAVLSGPTFAREVSQNIPAAAVAARR